MPRVLCRCILNKTVGEKVLKYFSYCNKFQWLNSEGTRKVVFHGLIYSNGRMPGGHISSQLKNLNQFSMANISDNLPLEVHLHFKLTLPLSNTENRLSF